MVSRLQQIVDQAEQMVVALGRNEGAADDFVGEVKALVGEYDEAVGGSNRPELQAAGDALEELILEQQAIEESLADTREALEAWLAANGGRSGRSANISPIRGFNGRGDPGSGSAGGKSNDGDWGGDDGGNGPGRGDDEGRGDDDEFGREQRELLEAAKSRSEASQSLLSTDVQALPSSALEDLDRALGGALRAERELQKRFEEFRHRFALASAPHVETAFVEARRRRLRLGDLKADASVALRSRQGKTKVGTEAIMNSYLDRGGSARELLDDQKAWRSLMGQISPVEPNASSAQKKKMSELRGEFAAMTLGASEAHERGLWSAAKTKRFVSSKDLALEQIPGDLNGRGIVFSGRDVFDVVLFSDDGKSVIIIEGKGGRSSLKNRSFEGKEVRQGSGEYLVSILMEQLWAFDVFHPGRALTGVQREISEVVSVAILQIIARSAGTPNATTSVSYICARGNTKRVQEVTGGKGTFREMTQPLVSLVQKDEILWSAIIGSGRSSTGKRVSAEGVFLW